MVSFYPDFTDTQDSCMTEFSKGQAMRMQAAYEMYRYKDSYSKNYVLHADGYSCSTTVQQPTTPGPEPTTDATTATTATTTTTTTAGTTCKGNNAVCDPGKDDCCSENYSCVRRGQVYACKSN